MRIAENPSSCIALQSPFSLVPSSSVPASLATMRWSTRLPKQRRALLTAAGPHHPLRRCSFTGIWCTSQCGIRQVGYSNKSYSPSSNELRALPTGGVAVKSNIIRLLECQGTFRTRAWTFANKPPIRFIAVFFVVFRFILRPSSLKERRKKNRSAVQEIERSKLSS
jgi:hypothetical protein